MSTEASPALLRARIQSGGVGPHPGIAGAQTGAGASGLVAPDLSGLGMAQRAGPAQGDECRVALLRMDRDGLIDLPPSVSKKGRRQRRLALSAASDPREPVQGSVRALEPLIFQRVEMGPLSSLWNELIQRYHYLGYRPLCGAQMRYLVWSADRRLLAALGFGASAWQVKARDQHIGWNHPQRLGGLHRIVNNARFLILPWVRCSGLASRILSGIPHHCGPTGSCATAMNRCCWKASWKCHAFPVPPTERPIGCGSEKLEAEANLKKTTNKLPHLKKSGSVRLHPPLRHVLRAAP